MGNEKEKHWNEVEAAEGDSLIYEDGKQFILKQVGDDYTREEIGLDHPWFNRAQPIDGGVE